MRVKVKLTRDCILWREGAEVNVLESQLPRFEGMYEKEAKKTENKAILKPKKTKSLKNK